MADTVIQIGLAEASAIGTFLSAGIAGAAKIMAAYLTAKDQHIGKLVADFHAQVAEERADRRKAIDDRLTVEHQLVNAIEKVEAALERLVDDSGRRSDPPERQDLPPPGVAPRRNPG